MTMIVDGTNGGFFPSWTTAGRPSSPAVGQMGYNTTIGQFDCYTSGGWVTVANSGNAPVSGPAFSAYQNSAQSLSAAAYTLGVFQAKEFDTGGCFNNTASTVTLNGLSVPAYSFCPNVAGYYQFNVCCTFASQVIMLLGLYKNVNSGSVMNKRLFYTYSSPIYAQVGSAMIYLNGTGDYVGVCNRAESAVSTTAGSDIFYFQGALIRQA